MGSICYETRVGWGVWLFVLHSTVRIIFWVSHDLCFQETCHIFISISTFAYIPGLMDNAPGIA